VSEDEHFVRDWLHAPADLIRNGAPPEAAGAGRAARALLEAEPLAGRAAPLESVGGGLEQFSAV
jgi:hypothetical protein